jgi:hypothetical protein
VDRGGGIWGVAGIGGGGFGGLREQEFPLSANALPMCCQCVANVIGIATLSGPSLKLSLSVGNTLATK